MSLIELLLVLAIGCGVVAPLVLLLIYAVWIQHKRGGLWQVLQVVALIGWPLDVLLTHTLFPLYLEDLPRKGEWTVSQQIDRLVAEYGMGPYMDAATDFVRACRVGRLLNRIDPLHNHIKSLAALDRLFEDVTFGN